LIFDEEEYRDWLNRQLAEDAIDRAQGREPVARSKEERLAMFYALLVEKRRAIRRRKKRVQAGDPTHLRDF